MINLKYNLYCKVVKFILRPFQADDIAAMEECWKD
jgi:hypothetical protein